MEIEYADEDLCRLGEGDSAGFTREIARGFQKAIWFIRSAVDERDLYAMKGLHFEKLKGARAHQRQHYIPCKPYRDANFGATCAAATNGPRRGLTVRPPLFVLL